MVGQVIVKTGRISLPWESPGRASTGIYVLECGGLTPHCVVGARQG